MVILAVTSVVAVYRYFDGQGTYVQDKIDKALDDFYGK
jgi:hypothetical protein